jgi:hypothetical protein
MAIAHFGFLGCVEKKESHTIIWTKTHIAKFLEVGTQKTTTIINLNVLQK